MIGHIISHYKILEKLGGGGMGVVYKAEDTRLRRTVALKFLPPAFSSDPDAKKRFMNEAQTASSLQHNNICNIHDIDETEDGQIFICMDLYEGRTLKEKIKNGAIGTDQATDIIIQIAAGLQKAHEKGIIHRDIKPANIFITNDGVVKILDFGLAKLAGQTMITKDGATLGTIAYMSPEQAKGEEVDQRTDIWSLGAMFYEMLSGKLPFQSDFEQAMIYLILNESPEPLTELRADIPAEMEKVITKCLSKEASDRYQNSEELIYDLNRYLDSKEIESHHFNKIKTKSDKWYSSKKLQIALLIILITVAAFIAGEHFLSGNGVKEKNTDIISTSSLAVLPFTDLSPDKDQDYLCEGLTEQLIFNLSKLKRLKVIARTSVNKFINTDKTVTEIGKELGIQNIIEGSVRESDNQIRITAKLINTANGFCIWSEEYNKELKNIFDIQDDISSSVVRAILKNVSQNESDKIKAYMPESQEAYDYYLKGKYAGLKYLFSVHSEDFNASESLLKKSIELDPNYALSYAELANLYNTYTESHFRVTDPNYDHYRELQVEYIHKALKKNPESSEVYLAKAAIDHEFNRKEDYFEDIIQGYKLNPQSTDAISWLNVFYHNINLFEKAIDKINIVIERDPFSSHSYSRRGWNYFRLGKYSEAEKNFLQAIKVDTLSRSARYIYSRFLIVQKRFDEWENIFNSYLFNNKNQQALHFAIKGDKKSALKNEIVDNVKFRVYLLLNMHDEALTLLEKRIDACFHIDYGCYYKILLNDPLIQELRGYERFNKILESQKKLYEYYVGKYGDVEERN